ncbi:MAG: hypothetical protein ACRDIE_16775 [Chloroflexota bacterium]
MPDQFSAERLLAFASGEDDEVLAAHLPSCAACAEAVAGYIAADRALGAVLYRAACPSSMDLGELALDLLEPPRATVVRSHLAGCPHCGAEFAGLRDALRDNPMLDLARRPSPLRRLIARLLSAPTEVMAYGMVGAELNRAARTYEVEGIRVLLTLEGTGNDDPRRWTLHGRVDGGVESGTVEDMARVLLHGQHVGEAPIDRVGRFAVGGLAEDVYDLELSRGDQLIVVERLPIGTGWEPARP